MGCSNVLVKSQILSKYSNYVICEHDITNEFLGKKIRVMNHNHENYKLIPANVDIYLNGEKKESVYDYDMNHKGKNTIIIGCKNQLTDINTLFASILTLQTIDVTHFDTSKVFNMKSLFFDASKIKHLNLSNFITNNVTDMSLMFKDCSSLESLDLSNFNTSKVTCMRSMFDGCCSLIHLNIDNFDTGNVTTLRSMFSLCSSLKSVNLSHFNTTNCTDMKFMFYECSSLTDLDLSSFNTEKVVNMKSMFYKCSSLSNLNIKNFCFKHIDEDLKDIEKIKEYSKNNKGRVGKMFENVNDNCKIIFGN